MAQSIRPSGKVRKIFYTVMNTPKELRQEGNFKKPTYNQRRTWIIDSAYYK